MQCKICIRCCTKVSGKILHKPSSNSHNRLSRYFIHNNPGEKYLNLALSPLHSPYSTDRASVGIPCRWWCPPDRPPGNRRRCDTRPSAEIKDQLVKIKYHLSKIKDHGYRTWLAPRRSLPLTETRTSPGCSTPSAAAAPWGRIDFTWEWSIIVCSFTVRM